MLLALALSPGAAAKPKETALPPPPAPGATRYFEPNVGQFDDGIRFRTEAGGYAVNFYDDSFELEAVVNKDGSSSTSGALEPCLVQPATCVNEKPNTERVSTRTKFDHASAEPEGFDAMAGISNYYRGGAQYLNVGRFSSIRYSGLYSGIDLVFRYNADSLLEFDLVVGDGADPALFGLRALGGESIEIKADGSAWVSGKAGTFRKSKPVVIPDDNSVGPGAGFVMDQNVLRIALDGPAPVGGYTIDPAISYSTYVTGSTSQFGDGTIRAVRDSAGNLYTVGFSDLGGNIEARVWKLAVPGEDDWIAHIDGADSDIGLGIAIGGFDADTGLPDESQIAIVGLTTSGDLYPGPDPQPDDLREWFDTSLDGAVDGFVARLYSGRGATDALRGQLNFESYLGGSETDCPQGYASCVAEGAQGIAFDPVRLDGNFDRGSFYVSGFTNSANLPTKSAYQNSLASSDGGHDAFFGKIAPDFPGTSANRLRFLSYFGGSGDEFIDIQSKTDESGNYWVSGMTNGVVPTTAGAIQSTNAGNYDLFAARFPNNNGTNLSASTMFGGAGLDTETDLDVDGNSSTGAVVTIMGESNSTGLPTGGTGGVAFQSSKRGDVDAYVTQIHFDALPGSGTTHTYGTYLGGTGQEYGRTVAVSGSPSSPVGTPGQRFIVGGATISKDFPTKSGISGQACGVSGAGLQNAFVTVIDTTAALPSPLAYSTCFGGSGEDRAEDLVFSGSYGAEQITLVGPTASANFPTDKGTPGGDPALLHPFEPAKSAPNAGFATSVDLSTSQPGATNFIAFASNRVPVSEPPYLENQTYPDSAIWKMAESGDNAAPVTPLSGYPDPESGIAQPGIDTQPSVSPDGQRIIYVSDRNVEQTKDLYVVGRNGPTQYFCRLTHDAWAEARPVFSPDGSQIAFSSNGSGDYVEPTTPGREIYLATYAQDVTTCPAALENRQAVTSLSPLAANSPTFSPDGGCVAYMAGTDLVTNLYIIAAGTYSALCPVGPTPFEVTADGYFNSYPVWSSATYGPGGHQYGRLAFGSARPDVLDGEIAPSLDVRIWLANIGIDGNGVTTITIGDHPLTEAPGVSTGSSSPTWSPDAASLMAYGSLGGGDPDIWRLDPADSGLPVNLIDYWHTPDTTTIDWWPSYGPCLTAGGC